MNKQEIEKHEKNYIHITKTTLKKLLVFCMGCFVLVVSFYQTVVYDWRLEVIPSWFRVVTIGISWVIIIITTINFIVFHEDEGS